MKREDRINLPLDLFYHRKLNLAKVKPEEKAFNVKSPSGTGHQITMTWYRAAGVGCEECQRSLLASCTNTAARTTTTFTISSQQSSQHSRRGCTFLSGHTSYNMAGWNAHGVLSFSQITSRGHFYKSNKFLRTHIQLKKQVSLFTCNLIICTQCQVMDLCTFSQVHSLLKRKRPISVRTLHYGSKRQTLQLLPTVSYQNTASLGRKASS